MRVIVDQPGDDGPLPEIDRLRAGAFQLEHVRVLADGDDALSLDRDRLRDREAIVDGDDLAVEEDDVLRGGGEMACKRGAKGKSGDAETVSHWHSPRFATWARSGVSFPPRPLRSRLRSRSPGCTCRSRRRRSVLSRIVWRKTGH